jgi:hypothetical protein
MRVRTVRRGGAALVVAGAHRDFVTDGSRLHRGLVKLQGASPYDDAFGCHVVGIESEGHSSYLSDDDGLQLPGPWSAGRLTELVRDWCRRRWP